MYTETCGVSHAGCLTEADSIEREVPFGLPSPLLQMKVSLMAGAPAAISQLMVSLRMQQDDKQTGVPAVLRATIPALDG